MNDFARTYAAMMEEGAKMLRALNPALAEAGPGAFADMLPTMPKDWMEALFGNAFNPGGLDAKTRLLVTLAGLVATGAVAEPQIRLTVRHLVEAGASEKEIAEVIWQMSMLGGLPAMNTALKIAQEVFAERNKDEEGQE
ncbi:MAG: carboxymuconolactone decarboxylase family protein [Alphaproteobacteria bacterium]|nr:MAG: carboxymuconolactone decarboxylase family protein [Alphaproteobacteria bacterium]